MLGLIVASGICGLLVGWYFKVYVILPMSLVLLGPAYFLGQADDLIPTARSCDSLGIRKSVKL